MRNILRRLRPGNSHTDLITGIKTALRGDGEKDVHRLLSTAGKRIGLPGTARGELTRIITGRLNNTLTHPDATTALHTLANSLPDTLPTDTLLTLENIARSIGCFHASHHFTQHAHHHIHHTPHPPETTFLSRLHTRNLPAATDIYNTITTPHTPFWQDAGHYLWLWSQGLAGTPHHTTDPTWTTTLTNHHITLLGPAPTTHTPPTTPHHLVARIIVPGVMTWSDDSGPFGSACDLAYANSRSTKWFIDNESPEAFDGFRVVSFRTDKWQRFGISNGRTAKNHSAFLMLNTDKTNMVPLMVWDALSVPDVTLTIAGTTFFATATSYTADNFRFSHGKAGRADARGSAGGLFERCLSFSHHAVADQMSFVANLVHAGAVGIDEAGWEVVNMSTEQYLKTLDELYGVGRV
jgi:hypothetical protein